MKKPESVDAYIQSADPSVRPMLQQIRKIISETAKGTEEVISYGMPAYKQHGVLVYFAANKEHLGFYPTGSPIHVFSKELEKYKTSKGAIQFPYDQKIPVTLVKKIVKYRMAEDAERHAMKKAGGEKRAVRKSK